MRGMLDTVGEILPILFVPDPTLRAKCRPVGPQDNDAVRALLPRMFSTMYQAPGIGLAAPQIGQKLRFLVADVQPNESRQPIAMINPEIVARSTELATREEGCLSLPGIYDKLSRATRIRIRSLDLQGKPFEMDAEGLLAVCIQHEMDHLEGKLFVDYLSELKRQLIRRRLQKERKQRSQGSETRASVPAL